MNITPQKLSLITARFRDPSKPKLTQVALANHMGKGRAWANKILNGTITSVSDEDAERMEEFLGIELDSKYIEKPASVPASIIKLADRAKGDPAMERLISSLLEVTEPKVIYGQKWVATQDMTKIGQEIIKIAFANEDKAGKVARMVLELLAKL